MKRLHAVWILLKKRWVSASGWLWRFIIKLGVVFMAFGAGILLSEKIDILNLPQPAIDIAGYMVAFGLGIAGVAKLTTSDFELANKTPGQIVQEKKAEKIQAQEARDKEIIDNMMKPKE
jgi:hypothetical protein